MSSITCAWLDAATYARPLLLSQRCTWMARSASRDSEAFSFDSPAGCVYARSNNAHSRCSSAPVAVAYRKRHMWATAEDAPKNLVSTQTSLSKRAWPNCVIEPEARSADATRTTSIRHQPNDAPGFGVLGQALAHTPAGRVEACLVNISEWHVTVA